MLKILKTFYKITLKRSLNYRNENEIIKFVYLRSQKANIWRQFPRGKSTENGEECVHNLFGI